MTIAKFNIEDIAKQMASKYVDSTEAVQDLERFIELDDKAILSVITDYKMGIAKEQGKMDAILATASMLGIHRDMWHNALAEENQEREMEELHQEARAESGY